LILTLTVLAEEVTHAAGGAAHDSGGLPQMDVSTFPSQIFWLAATFALLYWIMSSFVLPRLGGAIEERRDRIADDLDRAAESRRMAEEAEASWQRALTEARARAQGIAAQTREEVSADIARQQKSAEANLAERAAAAEARIAEMKKSAAAKVREAAGDTTRAIVETLIHETPTDAAVDAALARAAKG
jgi:F-type H+-transporting ATPase subunit b